MPDPSVCIDVVLGGVLGSIFAYKLFVRNQDLTPCPLCNAVYSFYTQLAIVIVLFTLILGTENAWKCSKVAKSIRKNENYASKPCRTIPFALLAVKATLTISRTYAEFRIDPLTFIFTDHLPFFCMFAFAYRFIGMLSHIRGLYLGLSKKMRDGRRCQECWVTEKSSKKLSRFLIAASEVRELHLAVNEAFGKELCLVQMIILFGLATNGFFSAQFSLNEEESLPNLTSFFCAGLIECGALSYFFALIGQSTTEAANDVYVEISSFPIACHERDCFDQVKYVILLDAREPGNTNAWTFYGLTMDSFFSTISTTVAFVFVGLQFNSNYSIWELTIFLDC